MSDTSPLEGPPPELANLAADLPAAELAARLLQHQRQRWAAGQRVPAEDYLRWFPRLAACAEEAVSLITAEVALRECGGEGPSPEEYLARFPRYADLLRLHFEGSSLEVKEGAKFVPGLEAALAGQR